MKRISIDQYKGWREFDYYQWLLEKVNCRKAENYTKLLRVLHDIPFEWSVPMDKNRALDGMELRFDYIDDDKIDSYEYNPYEVENVPCSCLEMMIALAEKFCFDVIGEHYKTTAEWFWLMIDNLEISKYTDEHFDEEDIKEKINKMIKRQYDKKGNGSMFPIHDNGIDQRKNELWYQLCAWFDENYYGEV